MKVFGIVLVPAVIIMVLAIAPANAETFDEICAQKLPDAKLTEAHDQTIDYGVINCWGFEDDSEFYYQVAPGSAGADQCPSEPGLNGQPNGTNNREPYLNAQIFWHVPTQTCLYPLADDTRAFSGNRALKIRYPKQVKNPGNFDPFFRIVEEGGATKVFQVGRGGEFWVRFSMLQDRDLLIHGVGKRFAVANYLSSTVLQEMLNAWPHKDEQSEDPNNTGDTKDVYSPAGRLMARLYSNSGREIYDRYWVNDCYRKWRSEGLIIAPCALMEADQWMTFEYHIIGATNADGSDYQDGRVELYVDGLLALIINNSGMGPMRDLTTDEPYFLSDNYKSTKVYSRLHATLYSNGSNTDSIHPEAAMWIDDMIVSKKRVPPIGSDRPRDTISPASPTTLDAQ